MGKKLAIDFGTTNSVIAEWNDTAEKPEILTLSDISLQEGDLPTVVPSLVYVQDAQARTIICGQQVRIQGLDGVRDNRLFRNFKRGIVASPSPEPRQIGSVVWGDRDAGKSFVKHIINALPYKNDDIEQWIQHSPQVVAGWRVRL